MKRYALCAVFFLFTICFSIYSNSSVSAKELEQVVFDYKTNTVLAGKVTNVASLSVKIILSECLKEAPSPTEFELYLKINQYAKKYFPSATLEIVGTDCAFLRIKTHNKSIFIYYNSKNKIQSVTIIVKDDDTIPKIASFIKTINKIEKQYQYITLVKKNEPIKQVDIYFSLTAKLWAKADRTLIVIVPSSYSVDDLETHINLSPSFDAPLAENGVIGSIEYACAEQPLGSVNLICTQNISRAFANIRPQSLAITLPTDLSTAKNKEVINQALKFGFLYIYNDGYFRPAENCTFADTITMLKNFYTILNVLPEQSVFNDESKKSFNYETSLEMYISHAQFAELVSPLAKMPVLNPGIITREEVVSFLSRILIQNGKTPPATLTQEQLVSSQVAPSKVMAIFASDSSLYKSNSVKSKIITGVLKGTICEILEDRDAKWYYVSVNTFTGWVLKEMLNIPDDKPTNLSVMNEKDLEFYVNMKNFESKTDYFLWVDLDRQRVNIFKGEKNKWKLFDSFACSSGRNKTPTIRGIFETSDHGVSFMTGNYGITAKYWTRFKGNYLFHSILYSKDGEIIDGILGEKRSHGCVRIATDKAEWIYRNIKAKTSVYIN